MGPKTGEKERAVPLPESLYRQLFYNNPLPMWIYDEETLHFLEVNEAAVEKYGYTRDEFLGLTLKDIRPQQDAARVIASVDQRHEKSYSFSGVWKHLKKGGEPLYAEISSHLIELEEKRAVLVLANDITGKHIAAEQLRQNEARLKQAQIFAKMGHWEVNFAANTSTWSDEAYRIYGLEPDNHQLNFEAWMSFIHPDDLAHVKNEISKSEPTLDDSSFYHRIILKDGTIKQVLSESRYEFDENGKPVGLYGIVYDLTERRRIEKELKDLNKQLTERAAELATSNADLERFAYVASHDLQEPLRMVSSFLELLEKKYKSQLDDTAAQYIHFAVDGAARMKTLIMDLLEYSRIGTNQDAFTNTDMDEVVSQVLNTLEEKMKEKKTQLSVGHMPVVRANRTQMLQMLQNLISNAFKYNRAAVPEIQIGCTEEREVWKFHVADNGIGIDERYFEKIFVIFQRLHNRSEYSGTGIGLSICRKIAEKHGGSIWLESIPGKGSTFYFTLKK
ncbi:MAG TPA: ATP-binding protein [Puia sp.]|nr:ATP-binding protein [Puia sp.]